MRARGRRRIPVISVTAAVNANMPQSKGRVDVAAFPCVGQADLAERCGRCSRVRDRRAAECREQQAFCEQLAKYARSARAHGEADAHFALAPRAAGQQEVGDVGAGQQMTKPVSASST